MESRRLESEEPSVTNILIHIVDQVLAAGATKFQVEYKDGQEHICVLHGAVGFGIAALQSSSAEAQDLRVQLYSLGKKPGTLEIDRIVYQMRVQIFDSFGEDAFRVEIVRDGKEPRRGSRSSRLAGVVNCACGISSPTSETAAAFRPETPPQPACGRKQLLRHIGGLGLSQPRST